MQASMDTINEISLREYKNVAGVYMISCYDNIIKIG